MVEVTLEPGERDRAIFKESEARYPISWSKDGIAVREEHGSTGPAAGQEFGTNTAPDGEEIDLSGLIFEDGVAEVVEDKVQNQEPGLHVAEAFKTPVLGVGTKDDLVHRARCQVVHMTGLSALDHLKVAEAQRLLNELVGETATVTLDEAGELAAQEVAGMNGD